MISMTEWYIYNAFKMFPWFQGRVQEGGIDKNEEKLKIDGTQVRKKGKRKQKQSCKIYWFFA